MQASEKPEAAPTPDTVGVRELRQNLSVYLRRIKAGETLTVTERGQPVAQLGPPITKPMSWIEELIATGQIERPHPVDFSDLPRFKYPPGKSPLDELIRDRYQDDR